MANFMSTFAVFVCVKVLVMGHSVNEYELFVICYDKTVILQNNLKN